MWQRRDVLWFQGGSVVSLIVPKVMWGRVTEVYRDAHPPFIDPFFSNNNQYSVHISYEAVVKMKLLIEFIFFYI